MEGWYIYLINQARKPYWKKSAPEVLIVQTERKEVRTNKTEGRYSPRTAYLVNK